MHRNHLFTYGVLALVAVARHVQAQDDDNGSTFVEPQGAVALENTAELEKYQAGYLQIRDTESKDVWILKVLPATTIDVTGQANVDYLRPGMSIAFDNELDRKGRLTQPIGEIELLPERTAIGLYPANEESNTRPVRNPEAGKYRFRAKVAAVKDNTLTVAIGGRRYTGDLSDDVKINFKSNDLDDASVGDEIKVKAWYFENTKPIAARNIPGRALAEKLSITLAKPVEPKEGRGRRR